MRKTTTPVTTLANKSTTVGMMPAESDAGGHDILPVQVECTQQRCDNYNNLTHLQNKWPHSQAISTVAVFPIHPVGLPQLLFGITVN